MSTEITIFSPLHPDSSLGVYVYTIRLAAVKRISVDKTPSSVDAQQPGPTPVCLPPPPTECRQHDPGEYSPASRKLDAPSSVVDQFLEGAAIDAARYRVCHSPIVPMVPSPRVRPFVNKGLGRRFWAEVLSERDDEPGLCSGAVGVGVRRQFLSAAHNRRVGRRDMTPQPPNRRPQQVVFHQARQRQA